jgi:hypothetical protein
MATTSTCWNLVVSKETDESVREYLASQDRGGNGDLSRFVEDAVRKQIFDTTLGKVHEQNANVPYKEIEAAVEESLAWARARML